MSIANAASVAYNEQIRSTSLFPGYVQENSEAKIVELIRHYYEYLNSKDKPSNELGNIIRNHDIDEMSDKYLTAIQLQIAKSVPNSVTLDKRRLFKVIAQYYKTRGSEESIHTFFRIFFNEFVTIFYPSSQLLHTSDDQSESSSRFRVQDGYRWQKYSYEIRTNNDPSEWKDQFLKFVHPAGLNLLIAIIVLSFSENNWEGPISDFIYDPTELQPDEYWNNIKLRAILGKHSPKWQPNTYVAIDYLFKVIIDSAYSYRTHTYPIRNIDEDELYAAVLNVLIDLRSFSYGSSLGFRNEYQSWLKYSDSVQIADGYANLTIDSASVSYNPINECRFETLTPKIDISDDYTLGYVLPEDPELPIDWENATITEVIPTDISNQYNYTTASGDLTYTSVNNLSNTISITAEVQGTAGNLITIALLNPINNIIQNDLNELVIISISQNIITITPMPGALASHITASLNLHAGHLLTATQLTANNGEVKPNFTSSAITSVMLTGGTKTIDTEIATQRKHRLARIPEADEIIF